MMGNDDYTYTPLGPQEFGPYVPRQGTAFEGTGFVLSGACRCGHTYDDHHDGGMAKDLGGCPSECEFYGSNESGGKMPSMDAEDSRARNSVVWVHHCSGYVDGDDPDPERHRLWEARQ